MARSMVSLGMDAFLAWSTAMRSLEFMSLSAPTRAATMISLASLVKMRPFAAAVVSLILVFHCAPMPASSLVCQKSDSRLSRLFINVQLYYAVLTFFVDGRGVIGTAASGDDA